MSNVTTLKNDLTSDLAELDFYAKIGAALFPIPTGSKSPGGIVESFKRDYSRDPAQWEKWRAAHGCNFGLVAFASRLIVVDIDAKGDRDEAWQLWCSLCAEWGTAVAMPHVATPSGGWHVLFAIPADIDPATLRQPDAIKGRINVRCIGYVVAAGSHFEGKPYTLLTDAAPYPVPARLLEHCKRKPIERKAGTSLPGSLDKGDVAELLLWLDERGAFTEYSDWVAIGMALALEYGGAGFLLWELVFDDKPETPNLARSKWESFSTEPDANSVTLATFLKRAHAAGWKGQVRRSTQSMFADLLTRATMPPPTIDPDLLSCNPPKPGAFEDSHERPRLIVSSGEFVRGFVPPDYVIDRMLQRGYIYTATAKSGTGKTANALRIAAHVATGKPLCGHETEKGTVLILAGENPLDVRQRWMAMTREMGIDPETLDVHFLPLVFDLGTELLKHELAEFGIEPALIIVDTIAAYFNGEDENDNVQAGKFARLLRSLTELPGTPAVLALAHPVKNASDDNLLPRGGGALHNELDGNIVVRRVDNMVAMEPDAMKWRGYRFDPIFFTLKVVTDHPLLRDTRGRQIPAVLSVPVENNDEAVKAEAKQGSEIKDEYRILQALAENARISNRALANKLGWGANHSKAQRALERTEKKKLIKREGNSWIITAAGAREMTAQEQELATAMAGAAAGAGCATPSPFPPMPER